MDQTIIANYNCNLSLQSSIRIFAYIVLHIYKYKLKIVKSKEKHSRQSLHSITHPRPISPQTVYLWERRILVFQARVNFIPSRSSRRLAFDIGLFERLAVFARANYALRSIDENLQTATQYSTIPSLYIYI